MAGEQLTKHAFRNTDMAVECGYIAVGDGAARRPSRREHPVTIPSQSQTSKEADLVVELLELLELEAISSALGRTKPARFKRSRIIWPLMLMSSGELEWRLWGKHAKSGTSRH